uniref:Lysine-specific demethylase n=1 Tax=Cyanoderma ruficeps TaxID=181631 RepID=A0A8C3RB32_9PASS
MESSAMLLSRNAAAELGLPPYPEPGKLSYGVEKGCPWRGSEGCLGPVRELAGGRLGCPYPPAPPCLRDALCRPKDGAELPPLLPPRNGQPKAGWGEPCKDGPGPRWAEAVLAPLALYSHPRTAAGDAAGDPPAFRHCPFLVEAKHSPFLLSSLLPTAPPAEPPFGGSGVEGPVGDGRFGGVDWRLGSYAPTWAQPLYLGVPPRCKGEPAVPELPGAPWRDGRAGGSSAVPAPHPRTPPSSASHPLFLLQPGPGGCGVPWVGSRPHGAEFSTDAGPGRPSEPKDERLGYQSAPPGSPPEPNPSPLPADGHYPAAVAKPEPPPACLCPTPGCDGCPGVGCGLPNPFEPTLGMAGGRFPCPPSNHTKLKKTWLTRHSEQSLPRSKVSRRDGGPEPPGEGKRSAKRPHGTAEGPRAAGEGAGAAKRGTKGTPPSRGGEPWCLQSLPCTALPPASLCPLSPCRFALGDNGELSVDGLCTLGEAEGELLEVASPDLGDRNLGSRNLGSRNVGSSLCLAKYLLEVLGDTFCAAIRRDRDMWPGAPGGPEGEGAPRLCDSCQRGFFNSHWSCARCGFQLCPDCHRSRREDTGMGTGRGGRGGVTNGGAQRGQTHPVSDTEVLTQLWKLLHEVRDKFGIESHCPCGEGSLEEPPGRQVRGGGVWIEKGVQVPPKSRTGRVWGVGCGSRIPTCSGALAGTTTLCDLLASTAVKLCLGQDGVRMAFAPVAPALSSDNRLTSILDSIIAHVVERKIQEKQVGAELSPPGSPDPPASHCTLAPSGLLWLHDPGHASNYKLFQEHWRQGQVSPPPRPCQWGPAEAGERLWGHGAEPVGDSPHVPSPPPPRLGQRGSVRFGEAGPECHHTPLCHRATNLRASLPLPEYCGASGRLNLATYLRGQRGRRWLCPRLRVAYGVRPQERNFGTKHLTVEAADSITVLAHAAPPPRGTEAPWGGGGRPGALWHIFRAEDAGRIRDFLRKVSEEPGQEGAATAEPPSRYLDPALRRRLRDECGVSGWSLLQFPGDAVLVPARAPHQVQSLSGTISVEQRFLSPESAVRLLELGTDPAATPRQLRAQVAPAAPRTAGNSWMALPRGWGTQGALPSCPM